MKLRPPPSKIVEEEAQKPNKLPISQR